MRPACASDAPEIHDLVSQYAAERLMLPRTLADIEADLDAYIVVVDANDRVQACAALYEYSPSLAEIGSVAVAREAHGNGLGSLAVRGAEAIARRRGIGELFAMTLTEEFFESLGYVSTPVERYPEKLARYDRLRAAGVEVVPRTCLAKVTGWA
ncbi:MAG TPA: GNAT family N-acetyltransferase [Gemmatimonadaceae bacterium]|nr:GNAT family N-acetyltransferase [Gemmatimonadaceae bacterium]